LTLVKKGEGWGEGVLVFAFIAHHSTRLLTGNKLNAFSPSQVAFSHEGEWWVISLS